MHVNALAMGVVVTSVKYIPMSKVVDAYNEEDYFLKTLFLLNISSFYE